jgi:hypothetical protein
MRAVAETVLEAEERAAAGTLQSVSDTHPEVVWRRRA